MSKAIPFEQLEPGMPLGPVETRVTAKAMQNYCEDWADPNPWYLTDSPFGGPIAPPAFMAGLTGFSLLATRFDTRPTIGTKTRHRNFGVVGVPGNLITRGQIAGRYIRRGLEYVVVASQSTDGAGNKVRESEDHILLSLERTDAADTPVPDTPPAPPERVDDEVMPSGLRVGMPIPGASIRIYQRALAEKSFTEESIHNDEYTRDHGYPGALVSAYVLCGYLSAPLVNYFGTQWFNSGEIALTFIGKGVQQGDQAQCHYEVVGSSETTDGRRLHLKVWLEKAGNTKAVVGTASVLWPE